MKGAGRVGVPGLEGGCIDARLSYRAFGRALFEAMVPTGLPVSQALEQEKTRYFQTQKNLRSVVVCATLVGSSGAQSVGGSRKV